MPNVVIGFLFSSASASSLSVIVNNQSLSLSVSIVLFMDAIIHFLEEMEGSQVTATCSGHLNETDTPGRMCRRQKGPTC